MSQPGSSARLSGAVRLALQLPRLLLSVSIRRSLTNLANLRSIGSFPQTAVRLAVFSSDGLHVERQSPPVFTRSFSPPLFTTRFMKPNQLEILSSRKSTVYYWYNFSCSCINLIKINGAVLLSMKYFTCSLDLPWTFWVLQVKFLSYLWLEMFVSFSSLW